MYRGTRWTVFEPNYEPFRAKVRRTICEFMINRFRQGTFQRTGLKDAYFVKSDAETTTQTDINFGIVNIIVGFAPVKPAEFVIIMISQIAGGILIWGEHPKVQSGVNVKRFDLNENFIFLIKWDCCFVAGVSIDGVLKRTTEVMEYRKGDDRAVISHRFSISEEILKQWGTRFHVTAIRYTHLKFRKVYFSGRFEIPKSGPWLSW
jgi:hypothetical protein